MRCPVCGFDTPPQARFCSQCGTAVADLAVAQPASQVPSPPVERSVPDAERRQLTVLFCDVVGSTELSALLDPEDMREVVRAYQSMCAEVIGRFDGRIAQYLGDGVLVYFGYPIAHEDDPQRAVRAGLEIREAARQLGARLLSERGIHFAVRQGIHTGPVVVGGIGAGDQREQLAVGETPNIAARIQSLADPDTLVISDATDRLVRGFFNCQELGAQSIRGIPEPITLYRVLAESGAQSRMDAAATTGLTPLVGRDQETALLQERWEQARGGHGQVVLLNGEPGIGKSRQVQALMERVASESHTVLECRCSPYYQNSALYPVVDLLERALRFRREESYEEKLSRLEESLGRYEFPLQETLPLFASLLSIPLDGRYAPLDLTPQARRRRTMEAMLEWLLRVAARRPTLLIMEDLHWMDPSTLDFLNLVVDRGAGSSILTVLTFRPEFQPPWGARPHLSELALRRLPSDQAETLATLVAGTKALPPEVLARVVANTDGVPLFVEELTKMVLESGLLREGPDRYELTGPLPPLAIPATLQDSLMARLDRLDTTKTVAQLGATLGREFRYELIRAVSPVDEATLQRELGRLVDAELLFEEGAPPRATYRFKHALIQDTAYRSLLRGTRGRYHQQIAQALAGQFPEIAETQPELLAHHYTEAGLGQQAIPYWLQAGQRAIERSANLEAIGHLTRGLELVSALPDGPEAAQQEVLLQAKLGSALMMTRGYTGSGVEEAFNRAHDLCQQLGSPPEVFTVIAGLWAFVLVSGKYQAAHELAQEMLTIAERQQDTGPLVLAVHSPGTSFFWGGPFDLVAARQALEKADALYDPETHRSTALLYGLDPLASGLAYLSWILWLQGYPDQALHEAERALQHARQRGHAHSLGQVLTFRAVLHRLRREVTQAQEFAESAIDLSTEQGFPFWLVAGSAIHGWALVEQGRADEGLSQLRRSVATWKATGARVWRTHQLGILGEALGTTGKIEEGLAALDEALGEARSLGEGHFEPELHRLRGELLLKQAASDQANAEAAFREGLDIARGQGARSWELRTAMSLARLWQKQGGGREAGQLVAGIYGRFTEGFDTPDLRDAKALIDQLGP